MYVHFSSWLRGIGDYMPFICQNHKCKSTNLFLFFFLLLLASTLTELCYKLPPSKQNKDQELSYCFSHSQASKHNKYNVYDSLVTWNTDLAPHDSLNCLQNTEITNQYQKAYTGEKSCQQTNSSLSQPKLPTFLLHSLLFGLNKQDCKDPRIDKTIFKGAEITENG